MLTAAPSRVFISYARRDGAALAQRLQSDLTSAGFDAWLDTQRLRGGATWTREIETALDDAQYVLVVLSRGSYVSEICRSEQLRALRKGVCVIPVKAQSDTDIPLHLEAKNYRDFSDPGHYDAQFTVLLGDIRGNISATLPECYRETPVRYLTAPPRVPNYLERPEALRALRDTIFAEDHRQPIVLTALAGMGGIGKTTLAKALTDDRVVQRAFPDGIVWITTGKGRKRDFIEEMREIAKALGDDITGYDTPLACENQYRTAIAKKAALVVVDDVWSKADIEPLLAESPRSRFLFTTRDASIGHFIGAHEHWADLLDIKQSRELLAAWSNLAVEKLPAPADDVIAECGRLPLALSVVGAMLRDTDAHFWSDTLDFLRKADLSAIEDQLPEGQQSFFKAVEVSFQSLKPEMQERYKALAVLLEGMPASLSILQTLWNLGRAEAARVAKLLVDRSLVQPDAPNSRAQNPSDDVASAAGAKSIRLHDLQLDYARAQFPDREALDLIHAAVRLSSHVIDRDPWQFASQVVGRLLPYIQTKEGMPRLYQFARSVSMAAPRPWLRPFRPALSPPGTALIRTLTGHSREVTAVAVSEDGRQAVSTSVDGALKVWNLETGRELRSLRGDSPVAITNYGRQLVSGSSDHTLKVWDLVSGGELLALKGHTADVYAVAVTPDGQKAVSAAGTTLKVWDLASGRELLTLKGHTADVYAVAVTPDGRKAISASEDKTVKVWDLASGRELYTLMGHLHRVKAVALTPDGQRAVSVTFQSLKVWDLESGRELRTLYDPGWVNGVAVRTDGRQAVSAGTDATLKVWDLESGRELRRLKGHSLPVVAVAVDRDWRRAVSASFDKTLKVWNLDNGNSPCDTSDHCDRVTGVAVSPDGRRAVSASIDQTMKVWDLESGRELRTLESNGTQVKGVAFTTDGRRVVSANYNHTLWVWDLANGCVLRGLHGHSGPVNHVALSADGRQAVSASNDMTLKVWDLENGSQLRTLEGHSHAVCGVALSSNGRRAVSASYDVLKVWDLERGLELHTLSGHSGWVNDVAVSRDGQLAVSACSDHTLKVWDVGMGRELRTLKGHTEGVQGVAVSGDGRLAVSASWDHTVRVWNLETGVVIATFTCDAPVYCCAFGDGRFIAGDEGGHVHFLRLEESERNFAFRSGVKV